VGKAPEPTYWSLSLLFQSSGLWFLFAELQALVWEKDPGVSELVFDGVVPALKFLQ